MIIGIDASRANRDRKSGTEYYSYYLIRNLAKIDSENQYILYTDKPLKGGLLNLGREDCEDCMDENFLEYDKDGYQIIKSPHNNFKAKVLEWPFKYFWTLGRLSLEMIFKKPDILFVPAHALPLVVPKKNINTIHDVAFERDKKVYDKESVSIENVKLRKIINYFIKIFTRGRHGSSPLDYLSWSTRHALKKAKKIITVSNFSKQEILDIYKTDPNKIEVIHNGYNDYIYKKIEDKEKILKVLEGYNINQPYILYIGRLEKKKNTPALIEAFAILKEKNKSLKEKLVLLGYGSLGYDEVKYLIEEYHLEEDVIMPGWVDEKDVPFLYNGAHFFVFPSKHEGFGIPLLQAMGCETPIICSDLPVLREIAQDAALFFNPNEIHDIADSMNKIIFDEDLKNDLIKKGKKRAEDFSWRRCAEETLSLINGLK